jgi:hypothetical protein
VKILKTDFRNHTDGIVFHKSQYELPDVAQPGDGPRYNSNRRQLHDPDWNHGPRHCNNVASIKAAVSAIEEVLVRFLLNHPK